MHKCWDSSFNKIKSVASLTAERRQSDSQLVCFKILHWTLRGMIILLFFILMGLTFLVTLLNIHFWLHFWLHCYIHILPLNVLGQ